MKPLIGITMGDAAGIGPEIILKGLAHRSVYEKSRPLVIGDVKALKRADTFVHSGLSFFPVTEAEAAPFKRGRINCLDLDLLPEEWEWGKLSTATGHGAFAYLCRAIEMAKNGEIDAICTAPLNKKALHLAGHHFPGHTEILARLTGTTDYCMMLRSSDLTVMHITGHVGLLEAVELINPDRTYRVLRLAHETLIKLLDRAPRIALCGINPHAGEDGLFGRGEEEEKLMPAVVKARNEGIDVTDPLPADTLFFRAVRGDFDIVVACYHDQGHGPVKALGLEKGVNITVGLREGVIRTSVDHGTAFDIAGKNLADEGSLLAAIDSAIELASK